MWEGGTEGETLRRQSEGRGWARDGLGGGREGGLNEVVLTPGLLSSKNRQRFSCLPGNKPYFNNDSSLFWQRRDKLVDFRRRQHMQCWCCSNRHTGLCQQGKWQRKLHSSHKQSHSQQATKRSQTCEPNLLCSFLCWWVCSSVCDGTPLKPGPILAASMSPLINTAFHT